MVLQIVRLSVHSFTSSTHVAPCHPVLHVQFPSLSINQSYLFIDYIKTFFSECGSNNWGTSCAQICLCDMAKTSDCNNVDGNFLIIGSPKSIHM
jgi:hypothetical protein